VRCHPTDESLFQLDFLFLQLSLRKVCQLIDIIHTLDERFQDRTPSLSHDVGDHRTKLYVREF
jgi:hypothetical protein